MKRAFYTSALATLLAATTSVGCLRDRSNDFTRKGTVDEYLVIARSTHIRHLSICDQNTKIAYGINACIFATDRDEKFDRFDEIDLIFVPENHPLEQYANISTLEEIYANVSANGKDQ